MGCIPFIDTCFVLWYNTKIMVYGCNATPERSDYVYEFYLDNKNKQFSGEVVNEGPVIDNKQDEEKSEE